MSGGIAYVWDPGKKFPANLNLEMVNLENISEEADFQEIQSMIQKHHQNTGSARAEYILGNWEEQKVHFLKVIPGDYKLAMQQIEEDKSMDVDEEIQLGARVHG